MSNIKTRYADDRDIYGICTIINRVWPEDVANPDRVAKVLHDKAHATLVTEDGNTIVGFVDGFMTLSEVGISRWEVDLLAVHPNWQRRGIATTLIEASTKIGHLRGAALARGLVAVENLGSQRAFARGNYNVDTAVCELIVASRSNMKASNVACRAENYVIEVNTIRYTGLWLEGRQTKSDLESVQRRLTGNALDLVGAVIPVTEAAHIRDAMAMGFERVGQQYQWWQCPFDSH